MRGASKASETATAQRIKGNFATLRLDEMQREVGRFSRDAIRLQAEVIVEQFSDDTLIAMSGVENLPEVVKEQREATIAAQEAQGQPPQAEPQPPTLIPSAIALLRDEMQRSFAVDIETDSTVEPDEQVEQQARVEMMGAVSSFMAQAIPAAQASPELAPVLGEMLLFGIRSFKSGRQLEFSIEEIVDAARDAPPQQQQPDPAIEKAKVDAELKAKELEQNAAETQAQIQLEQQKAQAEAQLKIAELQQELTIAREKMALDAEIKREQNQATSKPTAVVQVDAAAQLGQIADNLAQMAGGVAQAQSDVGQQMAQAAQAIVAAAEQLARPKQTRVVRDANGQITGAVQAVA